MDDHKYGCAIQHRKSKGQVSITDGDEYYRDSERD